MSNTITTMGIIATELYSNEYFIGTKNQIIIDEVTYKVEDLADTPTGLQALLLEEQRQNASGELEGTGQFVIAFRGTEPTSGMDWVTNLATGIFNYSPQFNYEVGSGNAKVFRI